MVLSFGLSEPYLQSLRTAVPDWPSLEVKSNHCCCGTSNFFGSLLPRRMAADWDSYVARGLLTVKGNTASRLDSWVCQSMLDATSIRSPAPPAAKEIR